MDDVAKTDSGEYSQSKPSLLGVSTDALVNALASRGTAEEFDVILHGLALERQRLELPMLDRTMDREIDSYRSPAEMEQEKNDPARIRTWKVVESERERLRMVRLMRGGDSPSPGNDQIR